MRSGRMGTVLGNAVVAVALLLPASAGAQEVDTTITSAPPAHSNQNHATFTFASESGSGFQCRLDQEAFEACESPHTITGLAEGERTFSVRALSSTGGPDPTPATHTWTVDYTSPDTVLDSAPPAATASTQAVFAFSSPDSAATFECSMNGGAWSPCASPQTYAGLSDGTRTFSVRAVDPGENRDATPATATWTVDATAPDTTITKGPPPISNQTALWMSATEPSTFECAISAGLFMPCSSGHGLLFSLSIPDGPVTAQVRAVDALGNIDMTPAAYSWTLDTVAPPAPKVWVGPRSTGRKRRAARGSARRGKVKIPKVTPLFQKTSRLQVRWGESGDDVRYDVRVYREPLGTMDGSGVTKLLVDDAPAGRRDVLVPQGQNACFDVRATDPAGNHSWDTTCARVPYEATAKREGWLKRRGRAYLHGRYLMPVLPYPKNRIVRTFSDPHDSDSTVVKAKKVYLAVTRCPDCERLRVAVSTWSCSFSGDDCEEKTLTLRVHKLKAAKTKRTQFLRVYSGKKAKLIHKIYVTAFGKARVEGFAFR